jgi:hypothetical protein
MAFETCHYAWGPSDLPAPVAERLLDVYEKRLASFHNFAVDLPLLRSHLHDGTGGIDVACLCLAVCAVAVPFDQQTKSMPLSRHLTTDVSASMVSSAMARAQRWAELALGDTFRGPPSQHKVLALCLLARFELTMAQIQRAWMIHGVTLHMVEELISRLSPKDLASGQPMSRIVCTCVILQIAMCALLGLPITLPKVIFDMYRQHAARPTSSESGFSPSAIALRSTSPDNDPGARGKRPSQDWTQVPLPMRIAHDAGTHYARMSLLVCDVFSIINALNTLQGTSEDDLQFYLPKIVEANALQDLHHRVMFLRDQWPSYLQMDLSAPTSPSLYILLLNTYVPLVLLWIHRPNMIRSAILSRMSQRGQLQRWSNSSNEAPPPWPCTSAKAAVEAAISISHLAEWFVTPFLESSSNTSTGSTPPQPHIPLAEYPQIAIYLSGILHQAISIFSHWTCARPLTHHYLERLKWLIKAVEYLHQIITCDAQPARLRLDCLVSYAQEVLRGQDNIPTEILLSFPQESSRTHYAFNRYEERWKNRAIDIKVNEDPSHGNSSWSPMDNSGTLVPSYSQIRSPGETPCTDPMPSLKGLYGKSKIGKGACASISSSPSRLHSSRSQYSENEKLRSGSACALPSIKNLLG